MREEEASIMSEQSVSEETWVFPKNSATTIGTSIQVNRYIQQRDHYKYAKDCCPESSHLNENSMQ